MSTTYPDDIQIPKTSLFGGKAIQSVAAFWNPSIFDAATGAIVALIALIGFAGEAPRTMVALAFVGVGIAFAVEAAGVARRSQKFADSRHPLGAQIVASALAELLTGVAGAILGLLALLGIEPYVLLPIASVLFAVALLFGTGAAVQVDTIAAHLEPSQTRRVIHEAVVGASGARLLLAFGILVLGALALAGVERLTLLLTVALSLAVALLLGSVSLGDRLSTRPAPRS
jgi:hypothetical protein